MSLLLLPVLRNFTTILLNASHLSEEELIPESLSRGKIIFLLLPIVICSLFRGSSDHRYLYGIKIIRVTMNDSATLFHRLIVMMVLFSLMSSISADLLHHHPLNHVLLNS